MRLVKLAAAALNQTPLDWEGNRANIVAALRAARRQRAAIVCLPELCITGYGCEDAFLSPGIREMAQRVLLEILPETNGMVVSLGLPLLHGGSVYNTACLAADGKILGLVGKQNLANDGIHYEPRWFRPWPRSKHAETEVGGQIVPIGDLIFHCGDVRIGYEICEDAWVPDRPGAELAIDGVDLLLNPSASHFAFAKQAIRQRLVLDGSRAFATAYVYANLLGNEAGRALYDGGNMIASQGEMLAEQTRFSFAEFQLTTAVVDLDDVRSGRAERGGFEADESHRRKFVVRSNFTPPRCELETPATTLPAWEAGKSVKEEEFSRAVALGLFDYLRKSRSGGFVVSLSGGADSSAVSTLVAMMVRFALAELGIDMLRDKLSWLRGLAAANEERAIVENLLTCVYQSTRNSGPITRAAAAGLARAIGARFFEFDVDPLLETYVATVEKAIGRPLAWETDDIALQNIQARVRSPGVWLLANLSGSLLLSTSNRSEAAVGYATMDGDTSGGLSPIAGIDKAFLRYWLRWMETQGPEGIGPLPALRAVNE
ncbi:MAG: NAD+ synthetase, partial [Planctomycetales bacterium]|nr:NAD+ synthetase [Planctomycetales bacterium]